MNKFYLPCSCFKSSKIASSLAIIALLIAHLNGYSVTKNNPGNRQLEQCRLTGAPAGMPG